MTHKVVVLFGGPTPEHEVSRGSARSVLAQLHLLGWDVRAAGISKDGRWFVGPGALKRFWRWRIRARFRSASSRPPASCGSSRPPAPARRSFRRPGGRRSLFREYEHAPAMPLSLRHGRRITLDSAHGMPEGLLVRRIGQIAFETLRRKHRPRDLATLRRGTGLNRNARAVGTRWPVSGRTCTHWLTRNLSNPTRLRSKPSPGRLGAVIVPSALSSSRCVNITSFRALSLLS